MAKIVIDAREYSTGTGRYIRELLRNLEQIDITNRYLVLLHQRDIARYKPVSSNFDIVATKCKKFTFAEQFDLLKQIDNLNADLVHFPMVQQPVFYRGKVVTTMQDLTTVRFPNPAKNTAVFWAKQQVYKWVNKRVAHKSVALITPTEFVKSDVSQYCHVPLEKITVTLEAADPLTENSQTIPELVGRKFVLYVGRPTPHKNLGRLIDAFALLQKNHPELRLVLAGKKDANYARHEQTVNQRGIKNVVFTDFISDGQLRWLYENCTAYVFPSLSEGFGLPGLEAMAHGAPVVSSNATCLPEVNGAAAHYFDPYNVGDMAAKIGEVLDNPVLRERLISLGKSQVKKYSWRRMAEQTLEVYERALKV